MEISLLQKESGGNFFGKMKCKNCNRVLTIRQKRMGWKYGKICFCGNACATSWSVEQHLKKEQIISHINKKK